MKTHIKYATQKLLADPKVKLVATVNHRDNFHLWAATRVFEWMTDSMDVVNRDNNAQQFNALCKECSYKAGDRRYGIVYYHHTSKSPTIRAICDGVYDTLNGK